MNNNIIKILFIIESVKINKLGKVPIKGRLTDLSERTAFSSGLFIGSNFWDPKKQSVDALSQDAIILNTQLSLIRKTI